MRLQDDMSSFSDWYTANGLSLNRSKTKVMKFFFRKTQNVCFAYRILGDLLSRVSGIRDLGVTFDSHLRLDDQTK